MHGPGGPQKDLLVERTASKTSGRTAALAAVTSNATALARLQWIVDHAIAAGLAVELTGLAIMRLARVPSWLADATDAELHAAHRAFWQGCARQVGLVT